MCPPDLLVRVTAPRPVGPGPCTPLSQLLVRAGPKFAGPTERHRAVYRRPYTSDDHAARKDGQDAGTISARPRTIRTPNAMPHSVLSTVSDQCTPRFGENDDFHAHSCAPPLLVTIKGGGGLPLKGGLAGWLSL